MLRKKFEEQIPEAMVMVLPPPPVRGVGRAGGFKIMIEDRSSSAGLSRAAHFKMRPTDWSTRRNSRSTRRRVKRRKRPEFAGMSSVFRANVPQVYRRPEPQLGHDQGSPSCNNVFQTLQIYLGSLYVNDFNLFGRTWQVIVQCESKFRDQVDDIQRLKVRNLSGPDGAPGLAGRGARGEPVRSS